MLKVSLLCEASVQVIASTGQQVLRVDYVPRILLRTMPKRIDSEQFKKNYTINTYSKK